MERLKRMTHAAHYGTRATIAEKVERPVAKHTRVSEEMLRSLFGALFLFWSARRVFRAVRAALR